MDDVYLMQKLIDFKNTEYYEIIKDLASELSNIYVESLLTEDKKEIEFKNKINGVRNFFSFIDEKIRNGKNKIELNKLNDN